VASKTSQQTLQAQAQAPQPLAQPHRRLRFRMTYREEFQNDIKRHGLSEYRGPYRDLIRIIANIRLRRLLQSLKP
jgi:hypothetical protein